MAALVDAALVRTERRHQEAISPSEQALDVGRIDVGWATATLCFLQVATMRGHRLDDLGAVLVLARVDELLVRAALADRM